jgi:hypothetical protein
MQDKVGAEMPARRGRIRLMAVVGAVEGTPLGLPCSLETVAELCYIAGTGNVDAAWLKVVPGTGHERRLVVTVSVPPALAANVRHLLEALCTSFGQPGEVLAEVA